MADSDFDVGVIDGGAAGLTVTSGSPQLGAKTLLVEKEPEPGGDCLHYGCVPRKTVAADFAKGAVLFDDNTNMMHGGTNYMVHASHRDGPGVAEIHELDADIMYVLEGTATLVTSGTAVDPKPVAPNEIRGTSIRDGEIRHLSKGDVVVIPKLVPHWFKSGPGGVWILSPAGKHLGTIKAHNVAWGDEDGKTLSLTAQSGLYRMRLNIPGIRP